MNVYNNCPLDARDFTDYRSSSDINNQIIADNNLQNSFEFNKFINTKGLESQNKNKKENEKLYHCGDNKIDNNYTVNDNDLTVGNYKSY